MINLYVTGKNKMKKQTIFECLFTDVEVISEKVVDEARGLKEIEIKLRWQKWGTINANGRLYPKPVLQRVIGDLNSRIELASNRKGPNVYGMPFHPADGVGRLTDVSHIFTKVWMEEDGACWGHALILANPLGQAIQALYEKGPIGVSSRGFGTMTKKTTKLEGKTVQYFEINDDFRCETPGDFVIRPSVAGAGTYESFTEDEARIQIQLCEAHSNEGVSLIDNKNEENMKTLEELKKENPEVFKLHTEALAEKDETITNKDSEIIKLEAELAVEKEKVKTLGEENAEAKEAKDTAETALNGIKDVVDTALETEEDPDKGNKPAEGSTKGDAKLKEDLKVSTEKVVKLEAEIQKRDDADVKSKLNTEVATKIGEELGKDEYKVYKALIEKKLFDKDGVLTVEIESVDKVEETIKSINAEISTTITEGKKLEITSKTDEKGIVHPEGEVEKTTAEQLEADYAEAKKSGYTKTLEDYKKFRGIAV